MESWDRELGEEEWVGVGLARDVELSSLGGKFGGVIESRVDAAERCSFRSSV